jgi:hypothetical protein
MCTMLVLVMTVTRTFRQIAVHRCVEMHLPEPMAVFDSSEEAGASVGSEVDGDLVLCDALGGMG